MEKIIEMLQTLKEDKPELIITEQIIRDYIEEYIEDLIDDIYANL